MFRVRSSGEVSRAGGTVTLEVVGFVGSWGVGGFLCFGVALVVIGGGALFSFPGFFGGHGDRRGGPFSVLSMIEDHYRQRRVQSFQVGAPRSPQNRC